jgi:hypothetical protein
MFPGTVQTTWEGLFQFPALKSMINARTKIEGSHRLELARLSEREGTERCMQAVRGRRRTEIFFSRTRPNLMASWMKRYIAL